MTVWVVLGGADGYPASLPVDPILVIGDRGTAVVLRRLPGQRHLPVSTPRQQIPGRGRRRYARATAAASAGWRRWRGFERRHFTIAQGVDRPHPERVGLAVVQAGHRVAGGRAVRGDPGPGIVQLVFVVRDRLPAVVRGRPPAQRHLTVAGREAQALGRLRRRGRGRGRLRTRGPARPGAVEGPHPERVGLVVGQAHHRGAGGRAARGDPGIGQVQLVFVVRERRPAGGLDPIEPHPLVAGRGTQAKRRVRRHQRGRRRGRLRTRGRTLPDAVHRPHPERVGLVVGQAHHRGGWWLSRPWRSRCRKSPARIRSAGSSPRRWTRAPSSSVPPFDR